MRRIAVGGALQVQNNQDFQYTPTRRQTQRPLRPPLQPIDNKHNAMMRVPPKTNAPLSLKSGNSYNMPPYDKQHGVTRPQLPTLSASAKTSNRTPLTPRVADSAPPTLATPLSRKGGRPENTAGRTPREDPSIATPVSSFLSSNITPRSGSRKSRVDSTNTTPNGTPTCTPATQSTTDLRIAHELHSPYGSGLGIAGLDKDTPKRPTVSVSPTVSDLGHAKSPTPSSNSGNSKFFFASDAKQVQAPKPPLAPKAPTFFYANGESIPQPQSSSTSAVGSALGEERAQPKFFHANGPPDLNNAPSPHLPPHRPSSAVSTASRITSPRISQTNSGTLSPTQRPLSPSKLNQVNQHPSLVSRSTPSLPSSTAPRPQAGGKGQSTNNIPAARRTSIEGPRVVSHGRSVSLGSSGSGGSGARNVSGSSSGGPEVPTTPSNIITNLPVSTPEEVMQEKEATKDETISEVLQSPIKTGHSLEHINELAANARRERKVLDLEITNSSLAAINRTLEREMRKQTAELRRYRRLSRSGRLSIATSASRVTSTGSLSMIDESGTPMSGMSGEEDESEEEDEDLSSEDSADDGALSPQAMAASDLRHRKRDERRLQLDLSKHQQLLVDSQKMNQSLKRCLGLTEELITEGKKALDYSVRVSDVKLGGRVLVKDEEGEDENEGMSDIGAQMLKQARLATADTELLSWGGLGRDDRDSGIEVDGQGEVHEFGGPLLQPQ